MTTPSANVARTASPGAGSSPLSSLTYEHTLGCVHCGLCLPACPTYQATGSEVDSPRGRIYLVRALAEGRVEDPEVVRTHLDRCLDCRACETACPSGVHYGAILENTRAALETQKPATGIRARIAKWMLRHVVIHQRRLRTMFAFFGIAEALGLRRLARILRLLPAAVDDIAPHVPKRSERAPLPTGWHKPKGQSRGKVGLFTGCVMEPIFGRINRATLRLLLDNGFEVFVPAAQKCCGALLIHAGLPDDAKQLATANAKAFLEVDRVINNSAGCGCAMREYGELLGDDAGRAFADKCRDISEFLAEQGLTAVPKRLDAKVAYDDPCHLCHGQKVRTQPRDLLAKVPGIQMVQHQKPEDCCGSAGIYNMLQPELAADIGKRKAEALCAAKPDLVATGNPGCMMQIAAHLKAVGSTARVVHPVELLLPDDAK
jgi:glycolate oxidase iron-sulfur subunit